MNVYESRNGDYMSMELNYAGAHNGIWAHGRHGYMFCVGMHIEVKKRPGLTKKVALFPQNKRCVGSCEIDIPPEDIDQVIEALQTARQFLQTHHQFEEEGIQRLEE